MPRAPATDPLPRVHRVRHRFVNLWLIEETRELTLIDCGLGGAEAAVERKLNELGRGWDEIARVLISHADPDHVGGAGAIRERSGAPLLAHPVEAAAMAGEGSPRRPRNALLRPVFALLSPLFTPPRVTVDATLEPGAELPVLGGLQVLATPGHTEGHVAFWAPARRVLFAGDALSASRRGLRFARGLPFVWDPEAGRASAERLRALAPRAVYCGHGPPLEGDAVRFPE